jgi:hypothetical protein
MHRITQQLPPCLFVPHTVKAWHAPCSSSSSGSHQQCVPAIVAGEALATVGVSTLASLLQEVRMSLYRKLTAAVLATWAVSPCRVCGEVCGCPGTLHFAVFGVRGGS